MLNRIQKDTFALTVVVQRIPFPADRCAYSFENIYDLTIDGLSRRAVGC
jgi:hypothetical protein